MLVALAFSALAACTTLVSAEPAASAPAAALLERHGSLVDVDSFVNVDLLEKVVAVGGLVLVRATR
jgi:hypothetical protein